MSINWCRFGFHKWEKKWKQEKVIMHPSFYDGFVVGRLPTYKEDIQYKYCQRCRKIKWRHIR